MVGIVVSAHAETAASTSARGTEELVDCHVLPSFRTQFQARVYSEDGEVRPINVVLETPRGPSTVAVRNIGQVPRAGRDWREAERSCCAQRHVNRYAMWSVLGSRWNSR